jgi:hypothetical protein
VSFCPKEWDVSSANGFQQGKFEDNVQTVSPLLTFKGLNFKEEQSIWRKFEA